MKARFELKGTNRVVLVLEPDYGNEDILMAAWMRYDDNIFSAYVERHENGHIQRVTLSSSASE